MAIAGVFGIGLSGSTTHIWLDEPRMTNTFVIEGPVSAGKSLPLYIGESRRVVPALPPLAHGKPVRPHPRAKLIAAMAGVKAR